jgi:hypothetical protein
MVADDKVRAVFMRCLKKTQAGINANSDGGDASLIRDLQSVV